MSTITTTSSSVALEQPLMRQLWLLPDNSIVLVVNLGTINFSTSNTNHTVVLQSSNWQTGSPTWTFVKQITSTSNMLASSWWDGSRLHIAYAGANATSTTGLFYISASYSGGTWTWDSAATTLLAASDPTNNASAPSIVVNGNGTIFVAYRNQLVASPNTTSVCMFTHFAGGAWTNTGQMSVTSGTSGTYYGTFAYDGSATILVTVESAAYYAQARTNSSGSWGTAAAGPSSQVATGQQYGPMNIIADGSSGAWLGISTTSGMKAYHLSYSGNTTSWDQGSTTLDAANNVSAPEWCYCNGSLYGYYFKTTSTNVADVYTIQYNPVGNTWSTATNLTNASASNNVNPVVPRNFAMSVSVTAMPIVYESGTASPFNLNLITQGPLAQTTSRDFAMRIRLTANVGSKDFAARANLSPSHDFAVRINLIPATVASSSLPDGMFGMTYGLRSANDTLDIRLPVLARGLGMTWFRIQQNISNIWLTQSDLTSSTITTTAQTNLNWASLDQAVGVLNQFGIHVTYPLRAVNGAPAWMFANPAQLSVTTSNHAGDHYQPDPANMALFAAAVAYRYDGVHGPTGPNGTPLKLDAIEIGNEEYNQLNTVPNTSPLTYGTYNSPYAIYNGLAGVTNATVKPARDPHFWVSVAKAVTPAIRQYNASIPIGSAALWWMSPTNFTDFVAGAYAEGIKGLINFWNFHYYSNAVDPSVGSSGTASITQAITNMQNAISAGGDNIPIWLGEFGWGTTDVGNGIDCDETTQAARYQTVLQTAVAMGVKKLFMYTLTYRNPSSGSETSSLIQYNASTNYYRKIPAFYVLQNFIKQQQGGTGGGNSAPQLTITPASLTFNAVAGGSNPAAGVVSLSNVGTASASWTASVSNGASWLSIGTSSGTLAVGASTQITVSANGSGFVAGTYNATVTFTASSSSVVLAVTFVITAPVSAGPAVAIFPLIHRRIGIFPTISRRQS